MSGVISPEQYGYMSSGQNALNMLNTLQNYQTNRFNLQQARQSVGYTGLMGLVGNPNVDYPTIIQNLAKSDRLGADTSGIRGDLTEAMAQNMPASEFVRQFAMRNIPAFEQAQIVGGQMVGRPVPGGTMMEMQYGPFGYGGAHFGPLGGGGAPMAAPGAAVGGGGAPGGGHTPPPQTPTGLPVAPTEDTDPTDAALYNIMMRESRGQNVPNAQGAPASGYFQMIPVTFQRGEQLAGIPRDQWRATAIEASPAVQYAAARAIYQEQGARPWLASAQFADRYPGAEQAQAGLRGEEGQTGQPAVTEASYQGPPGGPSVAPSMGGPSPFQGPYGAYGGVNPYGAFMPNVPPWQQDIWTASGRQYNSDENLEWSLDQRLTPATQALTLLQANPTLQTGPGQTQSNQWVTGMNALANSLGFGNIITGDNQKDASAYQQLKKKLMQNIQSIPGASQSTDLARLETEAANPNIDQTPQTIHDLLAAQVGLQRMQVAGVKYFRQLAGGENMAQMYASQYRGALVDWMGKQDSMAYSLDWQSPAAIREYLSGLKGNPQKLLRFWDSYHNAQQLFGASMPTQAGGGV